MSGARFARTGRCRFLVCFGILVLMVGMVAIFHSSQIQLDETREQRLHCEQQQETLNERLTSLVEQKFHLEKNQERERTEYLETKRNLEQKIKDLEEKHQKEQVESQMQYDKLQQAHKLLQSKHTELKDESLITNKQHLENINGLEIKLQSLKSELKKEKSNKSGEIYMWKEKYNTAEQEKSRLEGMFSATDTQQQQLEHLKDLENKIKEYQAHCDYKANELSRKAVAQKPDIPINSNPSTSQKTFKLQEPVSDGVYHIAVNITNKNNNETKTINHTNETNGDGGGSGRYNPQSVVDHGDTKNETINTKHDTQLSNTNPVFKPLITKHYNGSLILNSVENFQIVPKPMKRLPEEETQIDQQPAESAKQHQVAPLGAPKHKSSTPTSKSEQQMSAASAINATSANTPGRDKSSSTSNSPLSPPPNQKKLPANVAPYPNFGDLLQKSNNEQSKNVVGESDKKISPLKAASNNNNNNYDIGAHEDNMNDDSNLPHDEDINNFFDADNEAPKDPHRQKGGDDAGNNDDDDGGLLGEDNDNGDGGAAGDIAVKHNQLLDVNLKNEIADDQGKEKEFGDGLRLDEGVMEEDDEDDDYSNPSARKKADKAIRH